MMAEGVAWLTGLYQDFRHGARVLRMNPAFTVTAALSWALGIGANTAIFSIFNGLFLASLPYPEPQRLVFLSESEPSRNLKDMKLAFSDFEIWRAGAKTLDGWRFFIKAGGRSPVSEDSCRATVVGRDTTSFPPSL